MLVSDWLRTVFVHYEVDPDILHRLVPFELDVRDGKAYVSLVAFTLENLRLRIPARFRILPNHRFLNVRTYVRRGGEPGIYFLAEWLDYRPAVLTGPRLYGLPYRFGSLDYAHDRRVIQEKGLPLALDVAHGSLDYVPAAPGSSEEFLVERYTAFTKRGHTERLFRVGHAPWPIAPVDVHVTDDRLLRTTGPWLDHARRAGAHYSPGVRGVSISAPVRLGFNGNPVDGEAQACRKSHLGR